MQKNWFPKLIILYFENFQFPLLITLFIFSGQIVIEAIDFIPASSLEQLEPTTTFLEYSFPSKEYALFVVWMRVHAM
jgi:hypothetical protein